MKIVKSFYRYIYFNAFNPLEIYFRFLIGSKKYKLQGLKRSKNKRVVLVGTGPSLKKSDIFTLKEEGYDIVGVNGIVKFLNTEELDVLSYYVIQDIQVFEKLESIIEKSLTPDKVIYGSSIAYKYSKHIIGKNIFPLNMLNHIGKNFKHPYKTKFSFDSTKVVFDGYTVIYSAVQIMYTLGYNKIALLGIDAGYSEEISTRNVVDIGKVDPTFKSAGERINFALGIANKYLNEKNVSFYNYTRGGNLNTVQRKKIPVGNTK